MGAAAAEEAEEEEGTPAGATTTSGRRRGWLLAVALVSPVAILLGTAVLAAGMAGPPPSVAPPAVAGVDPTLLRAYVDAALGASDDFGGCELRWSILAGVARKESAHAAGRAVDPSDGDVAPPPILGFRPVGPDTDAGALDGDPAADWAVGPFRFTPATWAGLAADGRPLGRDGNGDGRADPNNAFDAAASAAAVLCSRVPGDYSSPAEGAAGLREALAAYHGSGPAASAYADEVAAYVAGYDAYGTATGALLDGVPGPPLPYLGGPTGCAVPDPTGTGGCVTGATAHLVAQTQAAFGVWPWGVSCWDQHAWNPSSSHPEGRACDYTVGRIGTFPPPELVAVGTRLAEWWRAYATELNVAYVVWQGRIWNAGTADWRPYGGGGVYPVADVTGGHWDHPHVDLKS